MSTTLRDVVAGARRSPSWTAVLVAWLAAGVALLVQHAIEPFTAGSHMGLFTNGGDLEVYRQGSAQILHGRLLYAAEVPGGGWFTYPPFAAIAFLPLTFADLAVVKAIWMLVSFAAVGSILWRCATVLGYPADRLLGLFVTASTIVALDVEAVRGTLWQGQVNLVLMAAILWDLTRPAGSRLRGWSVGLAAGVKLTAIVFVPYLILTRQWRAAATAAATACATVVVTWVALPADSRDYWCHAVFHTDRIGPLVHPGNYSLGGILATIWAPRPMPVGWWLTAVLVVAALGLAAAVAAERRGWRLLGVGIVGLLSCVVSPLAWGHHWVWVLPLLAVTVDRAARTRGPERLAWIAGTVAVWGASFMWFNAWLYRTALGLGGRYPTYVEAFDAAIARMTKADKLFVVATHPAMFLVVVIVTLWLARRASRPGRPNRGADGVDREPVGTRTS